MNEDPVPTPLAEAEEKAVENLVWALLSNENHIVGIFSTAEFAILSLQHYASLCDKRVEYKGYQIKAPPVDHSWTLPRPEHLPIANPLPVCWQCRMSPSGEPEFSIRLRDAAEPVPTAKPDHGKPGFYHLLYILDGWAPCFVLGFGPDQAASEESAQALWQELADRRTQRRRAPETGAADSEGKGEGER